jgi:CHAD domain-containing protein
VPEQRVVSRGHEVERTRFAVTADLTPGVLAAALGPPSAVHLERPERFERICLDTHDWRLWRRDARLTFEQSPAGGKRSIIWVPSASPPRRVPCAAAPRHAAELPAGIAREELRAATQDRALLALGRLSGVRHLLRVLSPSGKTVARLWWQEWTAGEPGKTPPGDVHRTVEVEPLTGYGTAAARIVKIVAALPGTSPEAEDEVALAAATVGRGPGDYTSKFTLALDANASAAAATRAILSNLLASLRANVGGVIDDLDSEFLHDLRVAVRRTRSALGQLRDVFEPARLAPFVTEFRWLGEATGPCRDADVHLEELGPLLAAVADDLRPAAGVFAEWLHEQRNDAHRRLVSDLRSRRFEALLQRWTRFLGRPWGERRTARGAAPVGQVAAERIVRAHRRLCRHVAALAGELAPGPMHRLRIDAKKLRYLLEFFASLCEAAESQSLIADLKALQDQLGSFHDAHVQRQRVIAAAEAMLAGGLADARVLLAMGALVACLEARQRVEGESFAAAIPAFVDGATARRFARLVRASPGR